MSEEQNPLAPLVQEVKDQMTALGKSNEAREEEIKNLGEVTAKTQEKNNELHESLTKAIDRLDTMEKAFARRQSEKQIDAKDAIDVKSFVDQMSFEKNDKGLGFTDEEAQEIKEAVTAMILKGQDSLTAEQINATRKANVQGKYFSVPTSKMFNTVIDPQGGYLTGTERASGLINKRFDVNGLMTLIDRRTTSQGTYEFVGDWSDYDKAYYSNELDPTLDAVSEEDYYMVKYNATEQIYSKRFSRTVLEDATINLESDVLMKLMEGAERQTAKYVVNGDGVDKPRGILTYPDGTKIGQIQQIESSTASSIVWDDVLNLLPKSLKDGYMGSFVMRKTTFFDLLTDKDGQARYQIGNQINFFSGEGFSISIMGSPVVWEAEMPEVADGALAVAYGDFNEGYTLVDRTGFQVLRDETDPKVVKIHLRRRNDGKVKNFEAFKLLRIKSA